MIVFGCAIDDDAAFDRWARPGIRRSGEPDSITLTRRRARSLQEAYNSILDEAAAIPGVEAVVLLHQDTEVTDPELAGKLRACFADPRVGVTGPIGGAHIDGLNWWDGLTYGRIVAPNVTDQPIMLAEVPYGSHEVETVDGFMIAVAPWAVADLRFDMRFAPLFHGYDIDYCFSVRARGGRCVVTEISATHYGTWKLARRDAWIEAQIVFQRKWGRGLPPRGAQLAWA